MAAQGDCDLLASASMVWSAISECATAPPARISAATQIASIISWSAAPSRRAPLV